MTNLSCFIVDDEPGAVTTLIVLIERYCPFLTISGSANEAGNRF